jgi:hypothetical protein
VPARAGAAVGWAPSVVACLERYDMRGLRAYVEKRQLSVRNPANIYRIRRYVSRQSFIGQVNQAR